MADIKKVNVGGLDYNVKDDTARTNASTALTELAYQETGNTASQAYSIIGTPINWKGTLYYTKTAVAKGATWAVGTNLTLAPNLGKLTSNIKTYVNSSGQLVFRDLRGADTVLPFSGSFPVDGWVRLVINGNGGTYTLPSSWKYVYSGYWATSQPLSTDTSLQPFSLPYPNFYGSYSGLVINNGGTYEYMPCASGLTPSATSITIVPLSGYYLNAWYHT